jgi:hypothetical protein
VQIEAIAVGGQIKTTVYQNTVQAALSKSSGDFQMQLTAISDQFAARVAKPGSNENEKTAQPSENGFSMVILTAILVSSAFFVVGLLIACFVGYSRNKHRADEYEKEIDRVLSSMKSKGSQSFEDDVQAMIEIPDEFYGINQSRSAPLSPDIEKNSSKPYSGMSDGGQQKDYQASYPIDELEGLEEVELVQIKEEHSTFAQVAAIIGGGDRVQTVRVCHHVY